MNQIDTILSMIARSHLNIETLETCLSDSLDFSDRSVANIKAALNAAFLIGCGVGINNTKLGEHEIAAK